MNRLQPSFLVIMVSLFAIAGCATYKRTPVEVGALDIYKSKVTTKGITIAADPIDNTEEAKDNFYVDVTKANFFPVLIIVQNDTSDRLYFFKDSVELTKSNGAIYRPASSAIMADACEHNKMAYALLGFGIFSYMSADEANRKMASDWRDKELPDTFIINPGRRRHGFLYFELPEGDTPGGSTLTFMVESLESKEKFPFEIVLPADTFGSGLTAESTQEIAYKLNPQEPWTGIWNVEGHRYFNGKWTLKQTNNTVVSTENSAYKIESLVVGDQLKGKIIGSSKAYPFRIKISSDGRSFKGTATDYLGRSILIKGKRGR
jgi:hypothetical protein